jgi:antitoxin component YwqK of YwqJK toxin-antitoxin module
MKSFIFTIGFLCALIVSCGKSDKQHAENGKTVKQDSLSGKTDKQDTKNSKEVIIVKEYYSNGTIRTETSAIGDLRQGLMKSYDRQGRLLSEVNYVDNVRQGIARNYYAVSGKVNSSLVYKDGIKEGDEIWYYESGQAYRVTPYVQGVINGIQKFYSEKGQILAEVPYKNGFPGTGLKEYKKDGTLITNYPKLIIEQKDHMANANKVILNISLSDSYVSVKFYRGSLVDGRYLSDDLLLLATQIGKTQIDFNVPRGGGSVKQKVIITANYKTPYGNPLILNRIYNLQVVNNN